MTAKRTEPHHERHCHFPAVGDPQEHYTDIDEVRGGYRATEVRAVLYGQRVRHSVLYSTLDEIRIAFRDGRLTWLPWE